MKGEINMKKIASILLALTICTAISLPAFAAEPMVVQEKAANGIVTPQAEETVWYYRLYNGEKQKRLWSITNGIWLTPWMSYYDPYVG